MNGYPRIPPTLLKLGQSLHISEPVVSRLYGTIPNEEILKEILKALTTAPQVYYFRLNLTKTTPDTFETKFLTDFPEDSFNIAPLPNSLRIPVSGPNKIPLHDNHVYCDKFACEAVMVGADLFVPGVQGMNHRIHKGANVSIMLDPRLSQANHELNDPVASGKAMIGSRDLPKYRHGIFINTRISRYSLIKYRTSAIFQHGLISEQNLPANIAVGAFMQHIWNTQNNTFPPNLQIVDTCSAPGHKSTGMSEWGHYLSTQHGTPQWPKILSVDRSANRLTHLHTEIERLGLTNIEVLACNLSNLLTLRPELHQSVEYLFLDPPCSALGTRPKLFIDKTEKELADYPLNQRRLLKLVDPLIKPGGFLMYNTCTIPKEENEDIVSYALEKLHYHTVPLPPPFTTYGSPGIPTEQLLKKDAANLRRFYPSKEEGIGYFIALLQKK